MTHRDRAGDPSGQRAGRREAAGPAGHRQGFPTPSGDMRTRSLWVFITDPWYYGWGIRTRSSRKKMALLVSQVF